MQIAFGSEDEAFRAQVREWLAEALTPELRAEAAGSCNGYVGPAAMRAWQRRLTARGWGAPDWPVDHGGAGLTAAQRFILRTELARAHAPVLSPMGVDMVAHVIIAFGTDSQRAQHLPKILSGEALWCQGYSEPQAGSDLAALATTATRDGDSYVLQGAKIWTTHAQYADWMFCLARTRREPRAQDGLSFLLVPMDAPGVSVRAIPTLDQPAAGAQEVNEVRLDAVRVPVANRVGEEGEGWTCAKRLLEFERGEMFAPRIAADLERVRRAAAAPELGAPLRCPQFRRRLAELDIRLAAVAAAELRIFAAGAAGEAPGLAASALKLAGSELEQAAAELMLEVAGPGAARGEAPGDPEDHPGAARRYFNSRKLTIYGGTSEIQRNILAKRGLQL